MDCTAALMNSSLGSHYFQSKESARKAVEEGLNHGTLFVALEDDVCTGFMYYIENGAFHSFPLLHLLAVKEAYRGQGIIPNQCRNACGPRPFRHLSISKP
jgi:hypothetical protein